MVSLCFEKHLAWRLSSQIPAKGIHWVAYGTMMIIIAAMLIAMTVNNAILIFGFD